MVSVFLTYCILFSLLFFLPSSLHKPLKQGLFLCTFLLAGICLALEKISFFARGRASFYRFLIREDRKVSERFVWMGVGLVVLSFLWHGYQLSLTFATDFQFHDADYIGMQEVIRNLIRMKGFLSTYYSVSGEGSYLEHHFSPALVFFIPFEWIVPDRWGYAVGNYFYLSLGVVFWTALVLNVSRKMEIKEGIALCYFLVLAILFNLYLYRIGTSYHFEVLVVPFSAIYFSNLLRQKVDFRFFSSLVLFLLVKEDIGIYLVLFLLPLAFKNWMEVGKEKKSYLANFPSFLRIHKDPILFSLAVTFLYLGIVFLIRPYFFDTSHQTWLGALSSEYRSDFKQVTGVGKSIQIFIELGMSVGMGILGDLGSFFGIVMIYLTHAFSTRPWHHEMYSYYCYTILPFLLFGSLIWMKGQRSIRPWLFFLLLSIVLFRNTQDTNFPIPIDKLTFGNSFKENSVEVQRELETAKNQMKMEINIFSQYNLSFFMPRENQLFPLSQVHQRNKICANDRCYLVIAPTFTEEKLVPSEYIKAMRNSFLPAKQIFTGKWIEVWESE